VHESAAAKTTHAEPLSRTLHRVPVKKLVLTTSD